LGGQLSRLDDDQETFAPTLMDARPSIFSPSQKFESPPLYSIDETAKVSFQPEDSDWVFTASVRYGRSAAQKNVTQQTNPAPHLLHAILPNGNEYVRSAPPYAQKFAETDSQNSQGHMILDFQAGKDVGLGLFGSKDGTSDLNIGVRFAQFQSKSNIALKSDPDWHFSYKYLPPSFVSRFHATNNKFVRRQAMHSNWASFRAQGSFHGIGPSISWSASAPFAGNPQSSELTLDWGLNAALLFGRQKTKTHHQSTARYGADRSIAFKTVYFTTLSRGPAVPDHTRSRIVTVPNVGGFAGLSYQYAVAKISFGYRGDFFFGAMDGGIDTAKKENVGFHGPFASVSVGLGG
jgi:iron complex outermembrane receptor protein